ncbi:pyridoxal-dependent decarboxylase domain protein [Pyronema domesticum]|nr:pyridoxal-dependent decarboxylase domain protein [Pyronema domesticum]
MARFDKYLDILHKKLLGRFSVPFWSPRYSAHMIMDTSMPATLGYFATMLYNPNNVAVEASPITTVLELEAGKQLCKLLGFRLASKTTVYGFGDKPGEPTIEPDYGPDQISAWGHITSGGTVANIEALWAARNLKFYPLALRNAMRSDEELHYLEDKFKLRTCNTDKEQNLISKTMKEITAWELLNIRVDDILDIPRRLYEEHNISPATLQRSMDKHGIQNVGQATMVENYAKYGETIKPMKVLFSSTNHYSWPKACALTGIGSENMIPIPVDDNARIDLKELQKVLTHCKDNEVPVCAVIGIVGSTEEGAVDEIGALDIRMDINHSFYSIRHCDSVTIDPHKSGYVPYAAGALCYRNEKMRHLLTWSSPYISRDNEPESIGIYGVEGSKPGAAAAAVWLSNCVIGEALFTSSMFSAHWAAIQTEGKGYKNEFKVVPFNKLPGENPGESTEEIQKDIRKYIHGKENKEILASPTALNLLKRLGSDLTINCFAVNFKVGKDDKVWNKDVEMANRLNSSVVKRMTSVYPLQDPTDIEFFLTSTEFRQSVYQKCADTFKKCLDLEIESGVDLFVLRNVVMSPYTTTDRFLDTLVDAFGKIVDDEIGRLIPFSDPAHAKTHRFLVQGSTENSASVYLIYLPRFFMANSSNQLIISAILDSESQEKRRQLPDCRFFLETSEEMTFSDLVESTDLKATLVWGKIKEDRAEEDKNMNATASSMSTVINQSLRATHREKEYPERMPFYIYGSGRENEGVHISHILLKAPNTMLCADRLTITLKNESNEKKQQLHDSLARGCVAVTNKPERLWQPLTNGQSIFTPAEDVDVLIFKDWEADKDALKGKQTDETRESKALFVAKLSGFKSVYSESKELNDNGRHGRRWDLKKNDWVVVEGGDGPSGLYQNWLKHLHDAQR